MDSHDELLIKLKDSKPKVTLITQPFYYHLLSSPTSRACISTTKRDPSVVNYCGFTCICEQSFVELKNFYQFVSLASLVLKKKYNHTNFTYSKSTVRNLSLGDEEISEPKLIHKFENDTYTCGIYICKSESDGSETEYQSVLNISDRNNSVCTLVNMVDSENILQTFFHSYFTTLCASPPFDTINTFVSGLTIEGVTYKSSRRMLTDVAKVVQNISNESSSFDSFVNTIEKMLLFAHRTRPYTVVKPNQHKLLSYLSIYGISLEPDNLLDLICVSDCITMCETKYKDFYSDLKTLKKNYNIGTHF